MSFRSVQLRQRGSQPPQQQPPQQQQQSDTHKQTKRHNNRQTNRSAEAIQGGIGENSAHNSTVNRPDETTTDYNFTAAMTKQLQRIRKATKPLGILANNSTYRSKYRGLPIGTPVPPINKPQGQWDVWEWWSGTGGITASCIKEGMSCGPPISHETGWCLKLATHRTALKAALLKHKPLVLYGAPTCGPWSQSSTNMDPLVKQAIRDEELVVIEFFFECAQIQHSAGRHYLWENPRGSELLRTAEAQESAKNTNATDNVLCMCGHELRDPASHELCMKQTILRGTVQLTPKVVVWCSGDHKHTVIQGRLPDGRSRTSVAQQYTKVFCKRLARDVKKFLKDTGATYALFPLLPGPRNPARPGPPEAVTDDEDDTGLGAEQDPYSIPEETQGDTTDDKVENRIEENRRERAAQGHTAPATPVPVAPRILQPTSKRAPAPPPGLDGPSSSRPAAAPAQAIVPIDDSAPVQRDAQAIVPAAPVEAAPPALALNTRRKPLLAEENAVVTEMLAQLGPRIDTGGVKVVQSGPKLRVLNELFGVPHGKIILAAVFAKKPNSRPMSEPYVSRDIAPFCMEIVRDNPKTEEWTSFAWNKYEFLKYARKPAWVVMLYARNSTDVDLPLELRLTAAEQLAIKVADDKQPLHSLPGFLAALVNGDENEKIELILSLHRRLYHKPPAEMKILLQKSGAPLHAIALVTKALEPQGGYCSICRNWSKSHAKPILKTNTSARFNNTVYMDLVFFDRFILVVGVDEATRYTRIATVDYKTYDSLEQAVRREWLRHFGPMRIFRSDRESAFAGEQFGVFLERYGIQRELVRADDQHSWLGILDRRVQLIRYMLPKLIDQLSEDYLIVDVEDSIAEVEFCVNSMIYYGGYSPYECLFGSNPNSIWNDEGEMVSQHGDSSTVFFEHQIVRAKAVALFQQAQLHAGLARAVSARPRSDHQTKYTIGAWVDFYRRPKVKGLAGWRGPAVVLSLLGDGFLTVRWQSACFDVAINQTRPHINVTPNASIQATGPPAASIADAPLAPAQAPDVPPAIAQQALLCSEQRLEFERTYHIEGNDTWMMESPALDTIIGIVTGMPVGTTQIHAVAFKNHVLTPSRHAQIDNFAVFKLGQSVAAEIGVRNYAGIILSLGRRYVAAQTDIARNFVMHWQGNAMTAERITSCFDGSITIDWFNHGVNYKNLNQHVSLTFLDAVPGTVPLTEILATQKVTETQEPPEGRVRDHVEDEPGVQPFGKDDLDSDMSQSLGGFDSDGSATAYLVAQLRCDHLLNPKMLRSPLSNADDCFYSKGEGLYYTLSELGELQPDAYYPLDKLNKSLSPKDLVDRKPEVDDSKLRELASWIKQRAGRPVLKAEYRKRTGLKELPSRWLEEWKLKEGEWIIKCRLVLKGFAESNQATLETSSPTASRLAHKVIMVQAAMEGWDIDSLDVSTAFLQGYRFEDLKKIGVTRQPCAFSPPAGTFALLAQLDPIWAEAASHPDLWAFELEVGAYGLKDAPLLWFLKFSHWFISHGFIAQRHDQCVFHKIENEKVVCIGSLHVDDSLMTGQRKHLDQAHADMEKAFGTIKRQTNAFRHFGVDIWRDPQTKHIHACQRAYLNELKPTELPKGRAESKVGSELITEFRSLVSAIAWVGVTSAPAQAGASLYQTCLPEPTLEDLRHLNCFLAQMQELYEPMVFRHNLGSWSVLRLVTVGDSSLGNVSKYSQGGHFILLCAASSDNVGGFCTVVAFRSAKSKRVASSSFHAETLAMMDAVENGSFLQTWFLELQNPSLTSLELINASASMLVPMVCVTDCMDLMEALIKPAVASISNRSMALYIQALREFYTTKRVLAWAWCDTRDNVANGLTKLNDDGSLPIEPIAHMLKHGSWSPEHPFRWMHRLCDAVPFKHVSHCRPPVIKTTVPNTVPCPFVEEQMMRQATTRQHTKHKRAA